MLRYKATFRCYSEWLERDSSDWDTRLALARVAALAGRTMKAVDIYEQLAGEDSLDFFVNYQLARLYQQIGKTVRAIGIYDRLYLEKPCDFDPFGQTGLSPFGYNMIDPLKSWCWGSILFYPFKISRFS